MIEEQLAYPFYDRGPSKCLVRLSRGHSLFNQVHKNLDFQLPFIGFRFNWVTVVLHKISKLNVKKSGFLTLFNVINK